MSPVGLGKLLNELPQNQDPNLLVGFNTSDDAAVYQINEEMALVTTADFITPPVDDPFLYGQIAAANALSDVYAMGGKPVTCLNLLGFPSAYLEPEVMHKIVEGALSKITEAGAVLAGGHSTNDEEPKFGLSVTGVVHPQKYWANAGAQPGDALILTKPIGSGVIFNANRKQKVSQEALNECLTLLTTLNKTAAEAMGPYDIHAATDITGFGLAGHSWEVAKGSEVAITIEVDKVPIMREALEMYEQGVKTGVNRPNRELIGDHLRFEKALAPWHEEIFFDPQTSGGLMLSLSESQVDSALKTLLDNGVSHATVIGQVSALKDKDVYLSFV